MEDIQNTTRRRLGYHKRAAGARRVGQKKGVLRDILGGVELWSGESGESGDKNWTEASRNNKANPIAYTMERENVFDSRVTSAVVI